jgi:hypothetical protein
LFTYNCPLLIKETCPTTGSGLAVFVFLCLSKEIIPNVVPASKRMSMTSIATPKGKIGRLFNGLTEGLLLRGGGEAEEGDDAAVDSCLCVDDEFELEYAREGFPTTCQSSPMLLHLSSSCNLR